MARRAQSSASPLKLLLIFALLLLILGGGYFAHTRLNDPFRTLPRLPVNHYLESANTLRGNVYKINGVVDNQLESSPTRGRLYALALDEGNNVVPILFPPSLNSTNLQKGQRFTVKVEVDEQGILAAKNLSKD